MKEKLDTFNDTQRIDMLEKMALRRGGLLLHDGTEVQGRTGLGIWPPKRTLRDAVDHCLRYPNDF